MDSALPTHVLATVWAALGGPRGPLAHASIHGAAGGLPSVFAVGALAAGTVAAATLAVAELAGARRGEAPAPTSVDARAAVLAFRSERHVAPRGGWELPPLWDPVAGDYRGRDGWIRLHTNYAHHRRAALGVLGASAAREEVAARVAAWDVEALERAVVEAGGAAAMQRTADEFAALEAGRAVGSEPLFAVTEQPASSAVAPPAGPRPLEGIRVLDLTRVIAGPVCTRVLAAWGADVLRVDPPGFEESTALLAETTAGKRRTALDLRTPPGREALDRLLAAADVLVLGYRADALERLGLGAAHRARVRPSLVTVALDAYGWTGPWAGRRGFDSLVQMSTGITALGQRATGGERPRPLPVQALDHGTGYLAAAAACRGLTRLVTEGVATTTRLSLARTAALLASLGTSGDPEEPSIGDAEAGPYLETVQSVWGPLSRLRCPGRIGSLTPAWALPAGPLGVDPPVWLPRAS